MKRKKRHESKCVRIICPQCAHENIVRVKRFTNSNDPIRCSHCGERIVIKGELTVVFEE